MATEDWRSPAAYEYAAKLGSEGFAWEFLRRNNDYESAYQALIANADPERDDDARVWGLRFPS